MSAPLRAGYKQTEMGVIPEDWVLISAVDACSKIQDGTHFSPRVSGNDYFYVTSKNIRFGYLDMSTASRIDAVQHHAIYRRCDVKLGDILLTKDGANTGNAALNTLTEEFSLLSSVAFLRFQQSRHCGAYFLQQILVTQGQRQIQEAMAGNAITRLTLQKINKLRFPVPPTKGEQEAIAEALSDADALIESQEQFVAKKRHLKQGAMQDLLNGKKRLPGFSGEWEVKRLGDIARVFSGGTPPTAVTSYYGGDIPWITSGDLNKSTIWDVEGRITAHGLENSSAKMIAENTLLIALYGATSGITAISRIQAAINQAVLAIIPKADDSVYLFFKLSYLKDWIISTYTQGGQPNLSGDIVKSIELSLPAVSEQIAIATVLSDMDAEITELEAQLAKARAVKQGMMHQLLTGKIRLI